jgi:hypothetical protein
LFVALLPPPKPPPKDGHVEENKAPHQHRIPGCVHIAEPGVKRSSTTVKVDRQQLINLLIDHGVLCAAIGVDSLEYPT